MPRKKAHHPPPSVEEYPDPHENDHHSSHESTATSNLHTAAASLRAGRKKSQDTHAISTGEEPDSPSHGLAADVAEPYSNGQQLVSRVGRLGLQAQHSRPVDIKNVSEKVTDHGSEYTPPSDGGLDEVYHKSPHSIAVSSPTNRPPEPGFARRTSRLLSPHISPALRHVRPASFSTAGQAELTADHVSRYGSPPAPHLPQPHFYTVPDLDLDLPQNPRSRQTFTKFIRLSRTAGLFCAVASAYGSSLVVSSFNGTTSEPVAALHNLPGLVLDAEPLHWSTGQDPFAELRPLVAVALLSKDFSNSHHFRHQVTVSVHSLSKQCHIVDLVYLPLRTAQRHRSGAQYTDVADSQVSLAATDNFLAVVSSQSGEIWLFHPRYAGNDAVFECAGKLWTTVQRQRSTQRQVSHNRNHESVSPLNHPGQAEHAVPLFTLSGRWLAICPPATSNAANAMACVGDHVFVPSQARVEVNSAPTRPPVNCEVDSPDADTMFAKVARNVAQEVVKAGKWVTERGSQWWQSYWEASNGSSTAGQPPTALFTRPLSPDQFPPTHADDHTSTPNNGEVVSLFDLGTLFKSTSDHNLTPFSTFKAPNGCSFLSLSPDGLMLLTASRTGEFQYVWNLMETRTVRAGTVGLPNPQFWGPRVHQIARFDRMSTSIVVDVAWHAPGYLAILTRNKTIHIFEIAAAALKWPPVSPSKRPRPISAPPGDVSVISHDAAPAGGFLASAMTFAGKTQPILTGIRGRTPSTSTGLAGLGQVGMGLASATGIKGTRAVAAGLSKSLGAASETMTRIQHASDNKLHIKGEGELPAGHIRWLRQAGHAAMCIVEGDTVRTWRVSRISGKEARIKGSVVFESRKPSVTRLAITSTHAPRQWKLAQAHRTHVDSGHPLTHAEIETHAPAPPFVDSRISMLCYATTAEGHAGQVTMQPQASRAQTSWVFGEDIPTQMVQTSGSQIIEASSSSLFRQSVIRHTKGERT